MTKKINWWIWERPSAIHIIYTAALSATAPLKKRFGECYDKQLYGFFKDGMIRWMCDLDELINNGKKIIPMFLDKRKYERFIQEWKTKYSEIKKELEKINSLNLKTLSDEQLLDIYNEFDKNYLDWWGIGQVAEMVSYGGEDILKERLTKKQFRMYFNILVTPTKKSAANNEEEEFFELVKLAGKKGFKDSGFKKKVKNHAKKYYWIQNSFGGTKVLDEEFFIEKAKKQLKDNADVDKLVEDNEKRLESIKREKEEIFKEINASEETKKIVRLLDYFCLFQDERKALDMQANSILNSFCREVARRKNIEFHLLEYCVPDQLRDILSGKEIPLRKLEMQKERCIVIFNEKNTSSEIFRGKECIKKEKDILGEFVLENNNELMGMCASTGRYIGNVRKIITAKDIDKMLPGEVLVSTMTTPNFIPAMKKAGAIVTDEGGITCHAAIVSRELGIPCVIGTKVATKIFEDGDIVEVRANHGTVRKIK
ncbi:hypothetical protein HQ533_04970 [Candidatus Woesearchaeota archaeon]|nr:hypothetical protein [Candidatus Woesearchaeota archaeon]